jgi:DNA-binding Lrp family transcriptional regulator
MASDTREAIIYLLKRENKPLSVTEMATKLNVSSQTVRNHIGPLQNQNKIQVHPRKLTNGISYELTTDVTSKVSVQWGAQVKSTKSLLVEWAENGLPKDSHLNGIARAIVSLYRLSVDALDDDNPEPIRNSELKEMINALAKISARVLMIQATAKSLLENDDLWDTKQLPKSLIMHDKEVTMEQIVSLLDRIREKESS